MASKRIAQSGVNWSNLAERVPPNQKTHFTVFKARSDKYLRSVLANPAESPKIDWAAYKSKIPNAALVESFQKSYEALKIPYPADTLSAQVEENRKKATEMIATFKRESEQRIAEHSKEMERIKALLPYDQMTMEDFADAHPELALDPLNNPTFWPHDEETNAVWRKKDESTPAKSE